MLDREIITAVGTFIALLVSVALSYWLTPRKGVHETGIEQDLRDADLSKSLNDSSAKKAS
ncbi:hypothetical protein [Oligoflexus tunisiensis]|uniref:hypothetical protein n=1 Tax=Oligoflexus tunisiensis TaxID=708132 RepID=UPI00114CF72E|nr:hypothetical protein [Oligoflexus tunisiensis]